MRERIYKFDNAKIFLIFLVVLGHCVELYIDKYSAANKIFIFIYSFHMPFFIFITGLFQKKTINYKNFPFKKILYYIYLTILMMIMLTMIDLFFGEEVSFSLLSGSIIYWYLIVITVYLLLVPILNKLNFKYTFILSILLGLAIGYDVNIGDYLYLSRIIVFFPFFYLGYYFSDKKELLIKITEKKFLKLIGIIIVVIYIYICYSKISLIYQLRGIFTGRNSYKILTQIKDCSYLHRLLAYFISSIIGFSFLCIIPNKKIKIITNLGKRTLQVYVFHQVLILLLKNIGVFDTIEKAFSTKFIYILMLISMIITMFFSILFFKNILDKLYTNLFKVGEEGKK